MGPSGTAEGQQIIRHAEGNAYHDFSRYLDDKGEVPRHKKAGVNFPAKLHKILSKPEFSHIITWMVRKDGNLLLYLFCSCAREQDVVIYIYMSISSYISSHQTYMRA